MVDAVEVVGVVTVLMGVDVIYEVVVADDVDGDVYEVVVEVDDVSTDVSDYYGVLYVESDVYVDGVLIVDEVVVVVVGETDDDQDEEVDDWAVSVDWVVAEVYWVDDCWLVDDDWVVSDEGITVGVTIVWDVWVPYSDVDPDPVTTTLEDWDCPDDAGRAVVGAVVCWIELILDWVWAVPEPT